jgi:uncharacterized protein YoxC
MVSMIYLIIPIITVIVLLLIISIILYRKNKKIATEIKNEKGKFEKYQKEINDLLKSTEPSKEVFHKFERVVKDFFEEYYDMNPKYTYLELSKKLAKKRKNYHSKFKYSNEKKDKKQLKELISAFKKITHI